MGARMMIDIDPEALEKAFFKRGLNRQTASTELGYNKNYFGTCFQRQKLSEATSKALKLAFNIDVDEYAVKQEETKQIEPTPKIDIDYEKLGRVIFSAVYQAIKKAQTEREV